MVTSKHQNLYRDNTWLFTQHSCFLMLHVKLVFQCCCGRLAQLVYLGLLETTVQQDSVVVDGVGVGGIDPSGLLVHAFRSAHVLAHLHDVVAVSEPTNQGSFRRHQAMELELGWHRPKHMHICTSTSDNEKSASYVRIE